MSILLACISMALKDALMTWLTVAEARGRPLLSGIFDALGDLAIVLTTLYGAGFVLKHGWSAKGIVVIGAMTITSFFGTIIWTKLSLRITGNTPHKNEELVALQKAFDELKARFDALPPLVIKADIP